MAAMPMLAGVGLLSVCCISSSIASSMMGGGETVEETKPVETTPVDPFPTSITGLSGRYDVGSATSSVWNDKSSNVNHAPVDRGTLKVTATGCNRHHSRWSEISNGGYRKFTHCIHTLLRW